jgi:acyl-[acyl-carrier-protein]-phospholipid O-acyltransferase/long-chain-fatty-acid--[acyl-carrier-protein] ligase
METPSQSPAVTEAAISDAEPTPGTGKGPLLKDRSFWGMTATQFLGAFNDNLFKQLVLLLAVGTLVAATADNGDANHAGNVAAGVRAAGSAPRSGRDLQPLAMFLFASPFILFSGYAGYLSERFSKRSIVVICKVAEIGIVLLGMTAFALWDSIGMSGLLVVLFLMGTHSAFFGPPKWGILPELFAESDLPVANGIILMTTFLAIIFGTALAGVLVDLFGVERLWMASIACLMIAGTGTQTALLIRPLAPANPRLAFTWSALAIPGDIVELLKRDRALLYALAASCMFWMIGGIVQPTVNSLGMVQFEVSETLTSILAAAMGVGIAIGCVVAGKLSQHRVNFRLVRIGAWLMVVLLGLLAIPGPGRFNLLRYPGTLIVLMLLGGSAGLFVVPIQVFLQSRPPESLKGRTIATMNLTNWLAIVVSAGVYGLFHLLIGLLHLPRATIFACTAALMLPVAIFYRPESEPLKGGLPKP